MQSKLIADFEALSRNEFWQLYEKTLNDYANGRALALRDAPLDKVARLQGELGAITWALSRPKDLIDGLTKGEQT